MGGSSKPQTQTTTVQLSPEQRQLMNLAMPGIQQYAANPPSRYQGWTTPDFNPAQVAAQNMALGATGSQQGLATSAAGANEFLLGDVLSPESNPALQRTIDASVRPITEQLTRSALPAIRSGAEATGNFGSSRQGIAEGLAIGEASQAAGDTASKVANQGYLSGLDAMLKGLALTPQTQQAQLAPAMTTGAVGDVRMAQEQSRLNDTIGGFNWDQMAPFLVSQDIMSLLSGMPGGSTQSTASAPQQNSLSTALGIGASAASLGSSLLPLLTFASDRRLKEDIKQIGILHNGLPFYRFKYKGSETYHVGLMADEVEKLYPDAVSEVNGFKTVDYGKAIQ